MTPALTDMLGLKLPGARSLQGSLQWRAALLSVLVLVAGASAPALLTGCATSSSSATAPDELTTAQDDSPTRKRARVRLQLATSYYEAARYNVALDEIKRVMLTDPTFSDAFDVAGLIYQALDQTELAERHFRRAIALNPSDGSPWHNLGWMQCQQKHYESAQDSFNRALSSAGYTARAKTLMAQGICLSFAGNTQMAIQTLERSYSIDPNNPVTAYNLSQLLYKEHQYDAAQRYLGFLNKSALANAQTLWLGIKVETALGDGLAVRRLGQRLVEKFGDSHEASLYVKGAFNE